MMSLPTQLVKHLRDRDVRIEVPDADTVLLRQVPVPPASFSKPATALLVKRPAPGMPFLAMVDADLAYVGGDPVLQTAFTGPVQRKGWRALSTQVLVDRDIQLVLQNALHLLGFAPPAMQSSEELPPGLISRFGRTLIPPNDSCPTVGREDQITQAAAGLERHQPCMPVLIGASGSGKSNLVLGLAHRLRQQHKRLVEVSLTNLLAAASPIGRSSCIAELLSDIVESRIIAAIEHVELLVRCVDQGDLLLSRALDDGARIVGTALPGHVGALYGPPLDRRIQCIEMPEPSLDDLKQIITAARTRYRAEIGETAVLACIKAASSLPGCFPGKAITLLDAAASLCVARGEAVVAADCIYAAAQTLTMAAFYESDQQNCGETV